MLAASGSTHEHEPGPTWRSYDICPPLPSLPNSCSDIRWLLEVIESKYTLTASAQGHAARSKDSLEASMAAVA